MCEMYIYIFEFCSTKLHRINVLPADNELSNEKVRQVTVLESEITISSFPGKTGPMLQKNMPQIQN